MKKPLVEIVIDRVIGEPMAARFNTRQQKPIVPGRLRIALFGLFGVGNHGNDASLEAMLRYIRRVLPNSEVSCICANPSKVSADFGIAAVPICPPSLYWLASRNQLLLRLYRFFLRIPTGLINWYKSIRYLRHVDMMIIPGTGILDDFGESPFNMPYALLRWCLAAQLCSTKVKFVSIGAGPIRHPLSRWLMKSAARMADYRSYRDRISKDFMESIGFNTQTDRVYPDLVFSLPRPQLSEQDQLGGQLLTVGVGVMAYYGWNNRADSGDEIYRVYIEKITQFVLWLLERKYRVRLLVGEATDQRAVIDLLKVVETRMGDLPKGRIIAEPIYSLNDLMREIVVTDIVVATRFHNVVCALMLNKPVVSCGYASKNDVLLADMGLTKYCQHIEKLDVAKLIEQFGEIARDRKLIQRQIQEKNREYQDSLAEQFAIIF